MEKEPQEKDQLIIQVRKGFITTTVCKVDIPDAEQWENLGLKLEDLSVYDPGCEILFYINRVA